MSLRIRANGTIVCAAENDAEPGDVYLDDAVHARLTGVDGCGLRVLVTEDDGDTWRFASPQEDGLRKALRTMLASAHPDPRNHPTMAAAWTEAERALAAAGSKGGDRG